MLIVFDGIDRAGKTTHLKMVANWLKNEGISFLMKREPGGTPLAEKIRSIFLNNKMDPFVQLLLLRACRFELTSELVSRRGELILCDRFVDSTYAYQGGDLDAGLIDTIVKLTAKIEPDFVFLFLHSYGKSLNYMDQVAASHRQEIIGRFYERAKKNPQKYFVIPDGRVRDQSRIIKEKLAEILKNAGFL